MNKERKTAIWLMITGGMLIVAAVALIGFNVWDDARAGNAIDSVMEQMATLEEAEYWEPEEEKEMPAVEIDGNRYIGEIKIPAINIELPVMESWDLKKLRTAPCRYTGTTYKDNLIICGHNYVTHFGRLMNLVAGDKVTFTDVDGNKSHYKVVKIETLSGTAVEEMQSGKWDLTLFTCTLSGYTRRTIRCKRTDK